MLARPWTEAIRPNTKLKEEAVSKKQAAYEKIDQLNKSIDVEPKELSDYYTKNNIDEIMKD